MKPLLSESQDDQALRLLGKASVQIVHDLKNHINGLKLYATFLRKRMEKSARPEDELETVKKLLAGLDRAAMDMSLIVQLGRPLELRKQNGTDLRKITESVVNDLNERPPGTGPLARIALDAAFENLTGNFDAESLTQSLTWISTVAVKSTGAAADPHEFRIKMAREAPDYVVIEWPMNDSSNRDPFGSLIGSDGLRMALAARIIEAHGGSAERSNNQLQVRLPLNH